MRWLVSWRLYWYYQAGGKRNQAVLLRGVLRWVTHHVLAVNVEWKFSLPLYHSLVSYCRKLLLFKPWSNFDWTLTVKCKLLDNSSFQIVLYRWLNLHHLNFFLSWTLQYCASFFSLFLYRKWFRSLYKVQSKETKTRKER